MAIFEYLALSSAFSCAYGPHSVSLKLPASSLSLMEALMTYGLPCELTTLCLHHFLRKSK